MCSGRIQLPLYRERTYGKNRRITVKNLPENDILQPHPLLGHGERKGTPTSSHPGKSFSPSRPTRPSPRARPTHATFEKKVLDSAIKSQILAHPRREGLVSSQWSDPAGWPTGGRRGRAGHGTPNEPSATGRAPAIGGPHDAPHRSIQPIRPSRPDALGKKSLKSANVTAT